MAKPEGDGWLSLRRLGNGWLSLRGMVAKLVARPLAILYTAARCVRIQTSLKIINGPT